MTEPVLLWAIFSEGRIIIDSLNDSKEKAIFEYFDSRVGGRGYYVDRHKKVYEYWDSMVENGVFSCDEVVILKKVDQERIESLVREDERAKHQFLLQRSHNALDSVNGVHGTVDKLCQFCGSVEHDGEEEIIHRVNCIVKELRLAIKPIEADANQITQPDDDYDQADADLQDAKAGRLSR